VNLLSEIFWGYVHGVGTELSTKFGWIWTSFAQNSWVEGLFAGFLDETGQSGFELPDRSDRSSAPVRPVCVCCAAIREVSLALLPRCYLGLLLRDSLSIAILADLGLRACGDFET